MESEMHFGVISDQYGQVKKKFIAYAFAFLDSLAPLPWGSFHRI